MEQTVLQVSDALALINQTLEYAYPTIVVEGEVSSFKVSHNKFVFFDIKDESATLGCFWRWSAPEDTARGWYAGASLPNPN